MCVCVCICAIGSGKERRAMQESNGQWNVDGQLQTKCKDDERRKEKRCDIGQQHCYGPLLLLLSLLYFRSFSPSTCPSVNALTGSRPIPPSHTVVLTHSTNQHTKPFFLALPKYKAQRARAACRLAFLSHHLQHPNSPFTPIHSAEQNPSTQPPHDHQSVRPTINYHRSERGRDLLLEVAQDLEGRPRRDLRRAVFRYLGSCVRGELCGCVRAGYEIGGRPM